MIEQKRRDMMETINMHTPGPWKVSKDLLKNGDADVSIRSERGNFQICKINYYTDYENDGANARLIAAAPEMLEAIKYYFSVLKEVRGENWDKQPDHALLTMLKAIAKAEGKTEDKS